MWRDSTRGQKPATYSRQRSRATPLHSEGDREVSPCRPEEIHDSPSHSVAPGESRRSQVQILPPQLPSSSPSEDPCVGRLGGRGRGRRGCRGGVDEACRPRPVRARNGNDQPVGALSSWTSAAPSGTAASSHRGIWSRSATARRAHSGLRERRPTLCCGKHKRLHHQLQPALAGNRLALSSAVVTSGSAPGLLAASRCLLRPFSHFRPVCAERIL